MTFESVTSSHHASQHSNQAQYEQYRRGHDHIAQNIADLMVQGLPVEDAGVQEWIGKHYAYICQFWKPTRVAYKSLALTYTMDPAFKATYEAYEAGLASFIQKAIYIWADANLE